MLGKVLILKRRQRKNYSIYIYLIVIYRKQQILGSIWILLSLLFLVYVSIDRFSPLKNTIILPLSFGDLYRIANNTYYIDTDLRSDIDIVTGVGIFLLAVYLILNLKYARFFFMIFQFIIICISTLYVYVLYFNFQFQAIKATFIFLMALIAFSAFGMYMLYKLKKV